MTTDIETMRRVLRERSLVDETQALHELVAHSCLARNPTQRGAIAVTAAVLVQRVRADSRSTLMEDFLAEYQLSSREGVALMSLAEALLRIPDRLTRNGLIEDKLTFGNWHAHRGHSPSRRVNSVTRILMLTSKWLAPAADQDSGYRWRSLRKRLAQPLLRVAMQVAMKELGRQFVLGRNIRQASLRAKPIAARGYTFSYDMLGEAACTEKDAQFYQQAYRRAIVALAPQCTAATLADNPGISVKLSALHPRYEFSQRERVLVELVTRTRELARQACQAGMGFNIDAEEADRLDLSLDVITAVLQDPELAGWDGFGVVVQAFGKRAPQLLDWLYALAGQLNRRIMVRLVKGAYWDTEIKRAQVLGLDGFPVYTRKVHTDVAYLCCAEKLLGMTDRIYPQFATHNAHSVAAVLHLAERLDKDKYEFQRLHGMGESLHEAVQAEYGSRCRIYAPVGAYRDLLAYLVRRLLENGANSSFVSQIADATIAPETIVRDPFELAGAFTPAPSELILPPAQLFGDTRQNSRGWDMTDPQAVASLLSQREHFAQIKWQARPLIAGTVQGGMPQLVINPADPEDVVGQVLNASPADIETAIVAAVRGAALWSGEPVVRRVETLQRLADLYEQHAVELYALIQREAGKTLADAMGELREAVDFARYYASQALSVGSERRGCGVFSCISPWNFPLAIFTGQVLAAVVSGNAVLAKPAEQTPLVAAKAVALMHEAGIPAAVVQLLPGSGAEVGASLTTDARIQGVCFTGSTATAQSINRAMAGSMTASAPLIAETGGLNAMIVDSTALPEQVVRDVLASAFQSAGQRCSALRLLYLQEDIAATLLEMLYGAMDELTVGLPWQLKTDIGPVIDAAARNRFDACVADFAARGCLLKRLDLPRQRQGLFVAPAVVKVAGIEDMTAEIFGPLLHVATFRAADLDRVVDAINRQGYGLTFGLQTRMESRIDRVCRRIRAGNIYVNRNQIGAVVGSQPFGGEGLSGTGPKAGGPLYLYRFLRREPEPTAAAFTVVPAGSDFVSRSDLDDAIQAVQAAQAVQPIPALALALDPAIPTVDIDAAQTLLRRVNDSFAALDIQVRLDHQPTQLLPGPTGELNRWSLYPRGVLLCCGPGLQRAMTQAAMALACGNRVVVVAPGAVAAVGQLQGNHWPIQALDGVIPAALLSSLNGFDAVVCGKAEWLRDYRKALAAREGALLALISDDSNSHRYLLERHVCIDTTAAGGNASLLARSG